MGSRADCPHTTTQTSHHSAIYIFINYNYIYVFISSTLVLITYNLTSTKNNCLIIFKITIKIFMYNFLDI